MAHEWEHHQIMTNGIRLHVVQAGPADGQLVILLHGFPEFWYGWRQQITTLAEAGFRVWAPDQRGYNLSEKPKGIRRYCVEELARDVVGLIDAAEREKAFVIGHDWGGGLAWWLGSNYPERIDRLVIMNAPHGSAMKSQLMKNPVQLLKSWYIFAFQVPLLPEVAARLGEWKILKETLKGSSLPGTFTLIDFQLYVKAWSQPAAYQSMVNWYRAAVRYPPPQERTRIPMPCLVLWGEKDQFLGKDLASKSVEYCENGSIVYYEDATHWVQLEKAKEINDQILEFLKGSRE